jgi:D-alanine--poly(phosphoribitol) ligase subunit 1
MDPVSRLLQLADLQADRPAVLTRRSALSYGELGRLVRRLAFAVAQSGDHPRVLIHLPQGASAYAAMHGVLLAGGYYSPVNLDAPAARQKLIREQFAADLTITSAALQDALDETAGKLLIVEQIGEEELPAPRPAHDLAYVIFTSGSTGMPKGVMIGRNSLVHYLSWAVPALGIGPQDRCSQHPNIGFDLSVLDIYAGLCSGAALVPLTESRDRLLPAEAVRDLKITIWISVPSVIDLMQKARQITTGHLGSLRLLFFCGEPLLPSHLASLFAALPDARVLNAYGPTEATVSCTQLLLTAATWQSACSTTVALGDPIPDMQLRLVGGEHDDEGEIVLSGPQLARGYWRSPERTAKAFRPLADAAAYFTGDWGERQSGRLFFRHRLDRQIKVHGHRFELGEIDAALRAAGVPASFTVLVDGAIVSFVEGRVDPKALRNELLDRLPAYGLPHDIRSIDELPRNANDKIDVQELTRMAREGTTHV